MLSLICLAAAFISFLLEVLKFNTKVNLTALGLALWTASLLLGHWKL